jgi:hypothetical protein
MRKHEKKEWTPRKNTGPSNELLESYCDTKGGVTFAEAKLPDDPYPNPREIDGVRFTARVRKLKTWSRNDPEFQQQLFLARQNHRAVEVIEVAIPLTRGAIGQIVVGAWILEQRGIKARMVLVCPQGSPTIFRELLKKHRIEVWSPNYPA